MKKFLLRFLLLFAPILFFVIGLELFWFTDKDNIYYKKNQILSSKYDSIETLFLGSSNGLYGIKPEIFSKKSFNFSMVSQSLDWDYALLKKYESSLPNLKRVVISLSKVSYVFKLGNSVENWREVDYYYQLGLNLNYNLLPLYSTEKGLKKSVDFIKGKLLNGSKNPINNYGWGVGYRKSVNDSVSLTNSSVSNYGRHYSVFKEDNSSSEITLNLRKIIKWGQENGIEIIFIELPVYKKYDSLYALSDFKHYNDSITDVLIQENKANKYFDFIKINNSDFIVEDFHDGDHLSEKGAAKLMEKFKKLINH